MKNSLRESIFSRVLHKAKKVCGNGMAKWMPWHGDMAEVTICRRI
jgi:hypothetical protein